MKDLNDAAFISLFKEAYQKCFGHPLSTALSETESRHLASQIFEVTGLVIGAKSLKNYSIYVTSHVEDRSENPSVATLDTLARYVLDAPYTTEVQRKDNEGSYPWWFQYKSDITLPGHEFRKRKISFPVMRLLAISGIVVFVLICMVLMIRVYQTKSDAYFKEAFRSVNEDVLTRNGWIIKDKDAEWWKKRYQRSGQLTLYTLRGDNWADSANSPVIKNLMLRELTSDCFVAEINLDEFLPLQNWQQAGILLLEDTTLSSKSVRLSIAYNDYFGGYKKPGEIIVQAINSNKNDLSKPEEIAHVPMLTFTPEQAKLVAQNMQRSALKIEKKGNHFRFLYSMGSRENFAFKEALSKDLDIEPKYIGIFALQGFVDKPQPIPAHIKYFSIMDTRCN